MVDRSVSMKRVVMIKTDTHDFLQYSLPEGYTFSFYQKGDERAWVELEIEVGQFDTFDEGMEAFENDFVRGQSLNVEERMIFVKDDSGNIVATGSLWNGLFCGKIEQKMHWIAVSEKCKGKGIAKALVTRLLQLYEELGYEGFLFLVTITWCYSAINIYRKFGFNEYLGDERRDIGDFSDDESKREIELAWQKIDENIGKYKK